MAKLNVTVSVEMENVKAMVKELATLRKMALIKSDNEYVEQIDKAIEQFEMGLKAEGEIK